MGSGVAMELGTPSLETSELPYPCEIAWKLLLKAIQVD